MSSGKITLEQRKASLHYHVQEYRKRRVIIDTDAACEADDPFAIAQALMSKMLEVKGICAEHFVAEGSMEQSYEMICRVTEAMGADVPVLRGQTGKMSEHQGEPMTRGGAVYHRGDHEGGRQAVVCFMYWGSYKCGRSHPGKVRNCG